MMILSLLATVVLLGVLFYHRVSLLLSSVILGMDCRAWRFRSVVHLGIGAVGHYPCALQLCADA